MMSSMPVSEWIAYALAVGVLLGGAALAAEGVCRLARRATRWAWGSALALTVILTALAPLRAAPPASPPLLATEVPAGVVVAPQTRGGVAAMLAGALGAVRQTVVRPVQDALAAVERRVPARLDGWLVAAWMSLSALLLALFTAVHARVRRVRGDWPSAELMGLPVRVAPNAGPAVVGLLRPQIVVPRWLLDRAADEQRLVLAHEQEHVRARDPLLLAAGCAAAALLPWHPVVWWMLARLRLSVELDCDRRLLRRGVAAGQYGTLLIDLAERYSTLPAGLLAGAPALADRASHLERRLLAMTSRPSRHPYARGAALAALAGLAILAACEAKLPTSAEIEQMDLSAAEHSAREAAFVRVVSDSTAVFRVDGVRVTAEQAHTLPADRIAAIEMQRSRSGGTGGEVRITTKDHAAAAGDAPKGTAVLFRQTEEVPDSLRTMRFHVRATPGSPVQIVTAESNRFAGLIYIDGVRASRAAMSALRPDQIESLEVIKSARAAALYAEPEAANGVIRIKTKRGGAAQ